MLLFVYAGYQLAPCTAFSCDRSLELYQCEPTLLLMRLKLAGVSFNLFIKMF